MSRNEIIEELLASSLPGINPGTSLGKIVDSIKEQLKLNAFDGRCSVSRQILEDGYLEEEVIESARCIQAYQLFEEGKIGLEQMEEILEDISTPVLNIFKFKGMRASCKGLVSILDEVGMRIIPKETHNCHCDYNEILRLFGCQCGGK